MTDHDATGRCALLIRNATIADGTGAPVFTADVAVEGERIAAVGELAGWQADEAIDAAGLVLAPGFIDCHTHDDRAVLAGPDMTMKVSQGVTTVVAGNCGVSLAPFETGSGLPPPFPLLGQEEDFRFPKRRRLPERPGTQSAGVESRAPYRTQFAQGQCPEGRPGASGQCRRTRGHGRSVARRHARGRDRFQHRARLSARQGGAGRRDHRASLGAARVRPRGLRDPYAQRGRSRARSGRGDRAHRPGGRCADRHLAPQMRGPPQLRAQYGNAGRDRGGAAGNNGLGSMSIPIPQARPPSCRAMCGSPKTC